MPGRYTFRCSSISRASCSGLGASGRPDAEVGVARALNDEPGALEVRAQVIEQGGGLRFVVSCRRCSVVDGHPAGIAGTGRFCEHVFP